MTGRGLTAAAPSRFPGASLLAARSQSHLSDPFHEGDLDRRAVLILVQVHFGDHRTFSPANVARGQPVQRIDQHVLSAGLAATEIGKPVPDFRIQLAGMLFDQVADHSTARDGFVTVPVKVEPVVPVSWTCWYSPVASGGKST